MSKLVKILSIAMVLTVILIVSVTGAAFAGNNPGNGNGTQSQDCSCDECVSDGDCIPNPYHEPGPHGEQKGVVGD
ncbi:hypothetical protein ACFLXF_00395 [Chloroflexota bacterium]